MHLLEAVAKWYGCPYGLQRCRENECGVYMWVDPRPESSKGSGLGTTGHRTLCSLFEDLNDQIKERTEDSS